MNFHPRSFAFLNSLVLKSFSPLSTRQRSAQLSPAVMLQPLSTPLQGDLRLVRSLLLTAVTECSNVLAIPTNPSPKSVLRPRRLSASRLFAPLQDVKSKRLVQLSRELQFASWRTAPYISCPGRVLLGEQQVLSKNLSLSKTIIYMTSCRNNVKCKNSSRLHASFMSSYKKVEAGYMP